MVTSWAIVGRSRCHAPTPWTGSCRADRAAAQAGSSRSIRTGSISRRATLARGSRWGVIPTRTSVRRRSGQRVAYVMAVIAPIEKPSRWNVDRPMASTKASTSAVSSGCEKPSATSQRVRPWARASGM